MCDCCFFHFKHFSFLILDEDVVTFLALKQRIDRLFMKFPPRLLENKCEWNFTMSFGLV